MNRKASNRLATKMELLFSPVLIAAYLPLKLLADNLAIFDEASALRSIVAASLICFILTVMLAAVFRNL